jgi:hypothetical protein
MSSRVHSFFTPIYASIFQIVVSASAYPVAFPQAFASQTIPLAIGLRLTPTLLKEPMARFSVPDLRLSLHLEPHYSPGYFRDAF